MRRKASLGIVMMLVSVLVLVLVLLMASPALAADTFHVSSSSGDDSNGGRSTTDALASIQEAVDRAGPGDVISVAPGVYEGSVDVETSGTADAWLTIRSTTRHGAFVMIPSGFEYEYGFRVAADYVEIDGFRITHEAVGPDHWGAGVTVDESHHTRIINNHVYNVGGNGIEFVRSDHSTVEGNVVHDNSRYAPNQTSGITLYQARAFDDAPGIHNVVRGNVSHSNANTVLRDGETTDGNGIIIDDFRNDHDDNFDIAFPHHTLVENNLVFGNGGKGIHVYLSDHVLLRNNTGFGNNQDPLNPAQWRGEFNTSTSGDVTWVNNIAVALPGSGSLLYNTAFLVGRSTGVTIDNNLTYGPDGGESIVVDGSGQMDSMVGNLIGVDPRFTAPGTDPSTVDFTLASSSPAVDAGTDTFGLPSVDITGQARILGSGVDLGAYEYGNSIPSGGDGGIPPGGIGGSDVTFKDVVGTLFEGDIVRLAAAGITRGCNPPINDRFCPDEPVTRGQMAAFLRRALPDLDDSGAIPDFGDTAGSTFEGDIDWLAATGVTTGCNPPSNDRFCPDEPVTRGQMAAFLVRALDLPSGVGSFADDDGSVFEADIVRLAAAGITRGCNPPTNDRFCPDEPVTRGQMAAFLVRALDLPSGVGSFADDDGAVFEADIVRGARALGR